jgi:hypothetical protein
VPSYDASGKKVVGFSSAGLPQVLASPRFAISNENRDTVVLRGTLSDTSKVTKKRGKSLYAPIFCEKDFKSLPDGTYVFRIGGALSKEHAHRDTQWAFCGRRGTSDEELMFTITEKSCQVVAK